MFVVCWTVGLLTAGALVGGIAADAQGVAGGPAEKLFHVLVLDQNLEMGHAIGALSPAGRRGNGLCGIHPQKVRYST